jgi:hypothetical protein
MNDHAERVIIFDEKLAAVIDANSTGRVPFDNLTAPSCQEAHCLVPGRFTEVLTGLFSSANEGASETIGAVICDPPVEPLGTEPTVVDDVVCTSADADDLIVLDANVERTSVSTQDATRLYPVIWLFVSSLIDSNRPLVFPVIRRPLTPHVLDAVTALIHEHASAVSICFDPPGQ